MADPRTLVEEEMGRAGSPSYSFDDLIDRRDRKRRNQRLSAGAVGIAVLLALVWAVTSLAFDRTQTPVVVPGGTAHGGPQATPQPSPVETLDTQELERELKRQIGSATDEKVRMVDCPTGVEIVAGSSFECVAEDRSDATFTILVTLRDDQGNMEWEVSKVVGG